MFERIMQFIKKYLIQIVIALAMIVIVIASTASFEEKKAVEEKNKQEMNEKLADYQNQLMGIQAMSFFAYDLAKGEEIFSKNEHEKLPLASLAKLMSGLVIYDILPDTMTVTIGREDTAETGDNGLVVGEKWRLGSLLDFSLITSSNDGMHALSRALDEYEKVSGKSTVDIMNAKAVTLGLKNTVFINPTGLDVDKEVSGAYSSSFDVAMLINNILKNDLKLLERTKEQEIDFISESNIRHRAVNTNASIGNIPAIIASKTGFTDLAGGNLAVVFDAGFMHPVIAVIMGSTQEGRFSDMEQLVRVILLKMSE
ncbi:MAG: serine hydrolase [archaeon]|jgi:D-alanyl-D-alanine carboxypeptidase